MYWDEDPGRIPNSGKIAKISPRRDWMPRSCSVPAMAAGQDIECRSIYCFAAGG